VLGSRAHNNSLADLQSFREALSVLQRQVENLDQLKARHYAEIIEHEEEVWDVVQGKVLHNDLSSWANHRKTFPFLGLPCGSFNTRRFR
jgi:hypothetical protein